MTFKKPSDTSPPTTSQFDWRESKHAPFQSGIFREKQAGPIGSVQVPLSVAIIAVISLLATLTVAVSIFGKL